MQINRLLETVYLLIEKKKITARELSDYFEVSQRTIYRDVEALSAAGIPVYAEKGKGGGIRLLDNYVIKKSLLSEQEQVNLLASLQGMVTPERRKTTSGPSPAVATGATVAIRSGKARASGSVR